jgi:hypothetical protein
MSWFTGYKNVFFEDKNLRCIARIFALFDAQNEPAGTLHLNRRAILVV